MEFARQPDLLFTILMFVVMISPLVFIHEFGHFLVGRLFRTKVDSFSIGFGREITGWTDRRGTRWKIGWLPLGGYVKFAGDSDAASTGASLSDIAPADRPYIFALKPLWQRALIVLAGPFTNFLAALIIMSAFIGIYGQSVTPPVVTGVAAGSPAAAAGIAPGDRIVRIGASRVGRFEEIMHAMMINPGTPVELSYLRGGRRHSVRVVPDQVQERDRFGNVYRVSRLGIIGTAQEVVERGPFESVRYGAEEVALMTRSMVETLWQVISGRRSVKELGGPLKMAQVSGQAGSLGPRYFVGLMALISINLGFINLLPVPMLDGGHLAIYAAEAIRRKPVPARVQEWAFMTGFALLISLMLLLTWNDLASLGVFKHVAQQIG